MNISRISDSLRVAAGLLFFASFCGCGEPIPEGMDAGVDAGYTGLDSGRPDAFRPDGGPIDAFFVPDPAPPWEPPLVISSEDGWRGSTAPLCAPFIGELRAADLWGDSRGLFALVNIANNIFAGYEYPSGHALLFNDGAGWVPWLEEDDTDPSILGAYAQGLTGIEEGPLFYRTSGCAVVEATGPGERRCFFAGDVSVGGNAVALDVVDSSLIWAALPRGIYRYDGIDWELTSLMPAAFRLGSGKMYGDRSTLVVAAVESLYTGDTISGLTLTRSAGPTGPYYHSIWGNGPNDVWASEGPNLLHFDGADWTDFPNVANDQILGPA